MANKKVFTDESLETLISETKAYTNSAVSTKANVSHTHTIANVTNLQSTLDGKASSTHTHTAATQSTSGFMSKTDKAKLDGIEEGAQVNTVTGVKGNSESSYRTGNINITKANIGLGNVDNTADSTKNVLYATSAGSATKATKDSSNNTITSTYETKADATTKLDTAKNYTDTAIANLVDSAPDTLNTLNELAAALKDDASIVEVLEDSIATKANASDLTSHTSNTTVHITSSERSNWDTAYEHSQATHARTDATKVADSTTNGNILINGTETNVYTLPSAGSALGGVKSGGDVTISSGVITVKDDSHNHTIANVDNLQASLDAKQATITGGATTIASSNLTASRALVSNSSGKVAVSAVTSTELGYLDGVTSNVQTQLDGKSSTSHTHNYAGSSSAGGAATSANKLNTNAGDSNTPVYFNNGVPVACTSLDLNTSGNAATATKLQTARTIGLGTGATGTATSFNGTANITIPVTDIKESYVTWGGKHIAGGVSPIDAACSNLHSANRFAFAKPNGITIEYSTDGSTYKAYSTSDTAKVNLVSGIGTEYYIGARSTSTTINDKLRITLNATSMGLYTRLRKLLIYISTNNATGSNVIVEKSMKGSESTYTTIGTYSISGYSGWNSIPIGYSFGGGSTQTSNIANLRLTFGITGVNSSQTSNALTIKDIIGIGDTYWGYPSNMSKTGHLYSYDAAQNATFPAGVIATSTVKSLGNVVASNNVTASNGVIANGTLSGNANTTTPFSTTTNLYYVNRKLEWNTTAYTEHVILLLPVPTSNNWSGCNYIEGKFLFWKTGANICDTVKISANCVYNQLRYHIEFFGNYNTWELCVCKYNGVDYYALKCPYHANPYTHAEFVGHIKSELAGGTSTVALPLDIAYYNQNTSTVMNEEVYGSITDTLTTTYITSVVHGYLYSKAGFSGDTYTGSGVATVAEVQDYLGI